MKQNLLFYVFLSLLLFVCLRIFYESDAFQLKCVIATKDGNKYCVRDRNKIEAAVELIATVTDKCTKIVAYMKAKHPNNDSVKRLVKGFNPRSISETLPTSEQSAYNENKGEKLAFSLNKYKIGEELIDINTLTFVAYHELAHIMNIQQGHQASYWQHFKFILQNAKAANLHKPVDYKKYPVEYGGMTIHDNPYFDLT